MTVCYLEVDDEITGAIARIRAVKDGEAIIVVPPGSRIATSRINFKLLVREGNERRLKIVAVSDEPSARALAISAGLPAYDSLAAAEQGLVTFREQDRRLAERLGRQPAEAFATDARATEASTDLGRARPSFAEEQTQVMPAVSGAAHAPKESRAAGRRTRKIGATPIIGAGALLLLLAGVGYGAYVFLPTATITLQPAATQLAPAPFTVVADPNVAVPDVDAGVVPAEWLEIPLTVTDQFTSTGIEAQETRATGTVRFRSENTLNGVPVPEGTVVSTGDGVDFETTTPALVPAADFATSTPGTIDVPVRASRPGPRGNVARDAITELSAALRGQLISVRNPDPTTGGERVEQQVISQEDYDTAVGVLTDRLVTELAAHLADPATTPRGLTVFSETARPGETQTDQTAEELVGTVAPSFALIMQSTAVVLAVNETLVDELAEARLRASLQSDQQLVGDEVRVTHSTGTASAETVAYQVTPSAIVYSDPDRVALIAGVRGKSIPDARQILAPYGMVEISIWPEFVDRLPDQTARISLVIVTPSPQP